jgi:hypothetical protein
MAVLSFPLGSGCRLARGEGERRSGATGLPWRERSGGGSMGPVGSEQRRGARREDGEEGIYVIRVWFWWIEGGIVVVERKCGE